MGWCMFLWYVTCAYIQSWTPGSVVCAHVDIQILKWSSVHVCVCCLYVDYRSLPTTTTTTSAHWYFLLYYRHFSFLLLEVLFVVSCVCVCLRVFSVCFKYIVKKPARRKELSIYGWRTRRTGPSRREPEKLQLREGSIFWSSIWG